MTDTTTNRVHYDSTASCAAEAVESRIKSAIGVDEETGAHEVSDRHYFEMLVIEMLAQQVAARRHLFILSTISVAGAIIWLIGLIMLLDLIPG